MFSRFHCASGSWKKLFVLPSWEVLWNAGSRSISEKRHLAIIFIHILQSFFFLKNSTNQNVLFEFLKDTSKSHRYIHKYWRASGFLVGCVCKVAHLLSPVPRPPIILGNLWLRQLAPWVVGRDLKLRRCQNEDATSFIMTGIHRASSAAWSLTGVKGVVRMGGWQPGWHETRPSYRGSLRQRWQVASA